MTEKKFHQAMIDLYEITKKECGYKAVRFLQKVCTEGGLAAAKQFISKPGGADGFRRLWECDRLDLSIEAYVLKPEYRELFTDEERALCRERLEQYGYHFV